MHDVIDMLDQLDECLLTEQDPPEWIRQVFLRAGRKADRG